jgi:hypothetical protein
MFLEAVSKIPPTGEGAITPRIGVFGDRPLRLRPKTPTFIRPFGMPPFAVPCTPWGNFEMVSNLTSFFLNFRPI